MTELEYSKLVADLTGTFPGIVNFIVMAGGDPDATFRKLFPVVRDFEYSDALDVMKDLTIRGMSPADIKMPMHVVRSMLARKSGERAKRRQADRQAAEFAASRGLSAVSHQSNMSECFLKLRPIHKEFLDGEISATEYEGLKTDILAGVK